MNMEITEKYNNFVKLIENKEKLEWLKQNNQNNQNNQDNQNLENCSCGISSGYTSIYSNKSNKSKNNSKENIFIDDKFSEENNELSLLEDDYFIGKKKSFNNINNLDKSDNLNNSDNLYNSYNSDKSNSIKTEFQNIFLIDDYMKDKKIKKNESSEIKNKLEDMYNKILSKKSKKKNNQNNKLIEFEISNYIKLNPNESENKVITKPKLDDNIKNLSNMLEFIFNESIRGWNQENSLYILHLDKLKDNLKKISYNDNFKNEIKFGFIYRNFNEPKIYVCNDFTKYWIGYINESKNPNQLYQTKYTMKDKILFYCLKNLIKSNKFKKKISKWNYKFLKKTVQIYGHKNLLIDIILFLGIKNIEN